MIDAKLLRDIIGAWDVLGMALEPDTDDEAEAMHAIADRGLCQHTPAGFVPTDAGRLVNAGPFAITLRSRWYPDTDWAAVTLSAKEPGRVQLTRFDDEGPRGDTCHDTIVEALREGMKWHGLIVATIEPADHHLALDAVSAALREENDRRLLVEQCLASMSPET